MLIEEELSHRIIGAAIEAHRKLGPGLLESADEECLRHERSLSSVRFRRQLELPVRFKALQLDCGYRMDLLVKEKFVFELKCVEAIAPIHKAQHLTYL
ncbi:MAG: GxxExxY protein [Planctomycetia bacterium]|nr:GxxExxY protein [Planctomycetia bacterium]